MRRLTITLVAAAALAAACGGAEEDAPVPGPVTTGPTEAELVFREKVLEEIKRGKYKCYCTAAQRARERIEKGLANEPSRGG
jgi:hypothetical protein